ncbi:MAG TPA: DoxX family protein [Stellaceae bacterium]|jgi:putative oxidoreductase|nr:DoxX family protein [Stellaceae bacterium]
MKILDHQSSERMLSVLRIIVGLLFVEHGLSKLVGFPHVVMFDKLQFFSLLGLAGFIELVGGALLTVGLFTRITAFIMSGEMAFAYFIVHAPKSFYPALNGGELAIVYCFLLLYFAAAGAGAWSLDQLRLGSARTTGAYDRHVSVGGDD